MKKLLLLLIPLLVLVVAGGSWYYWQSGRSKAPMPSATTKKSSRSATLRLLSGSHFPVNQPQTLKFQIRSQDGEVFKDYDTSNTYNLTLYVIRKDRTNFQQIYPAYDSRTGTFTVSGMLFGAPGPYRMFGQFTSRDKVQAAPFTDITVGYQKNYTPNPPQTAVLASSANGFDASIYFIQGDDSPGAAVNYYMANATNPVAVQFNRGGVAYTNLETYKGSIARIAAFGPDLEFSAVNSEPEVGPQSGLAVFSLQLSGPGLYVLFAQTEVNDQVSTFSFNVPVK